MNVEWLASADGQEVISRAAQRGSGPGDIEWLRRAYPDVPIEEVGAAVHQAWLRQRATKRWGVTTDFLLTTDGLEQATRPEVADYHARRVSQLIGRPAHVIDLTCGLGFDAAAMARAGHTVAAVERDPEVAALARHNLATLGVSVTVGDAADFAIPGGTDVVFIDPARRDPTAARDIGGQTKRMLSPQQWSPSWDFIQRLAEPHRVLAKVAPGIGDEYLDGWDVEFVSASGSLVEALAISSGTGARTAVLLSSDGDAQVIAGGAVTPAGALGRYLIAPDPALVRARALSWLADRVHGALIHPMIAWLTSDDTAACERLARDRHRPASVFTVLTSLPYDLKRLRRAVAAQPHSSLTVMTRGVSLDVERVRRELVGTTTPGAPELVVATYRGERGTTAVLAHRLIT